MRRIKENTISTGFGFTKEDLLLIYNKIANTDNTISNALKLTKEFKVLDEITSIVLAGSGINSIASMLLKSYLSSISLRLPVLAISDYSLPEYINSKTLVFIIAYNGDDAEAVSLYKNALRKGAKIVVLSAYGKCLDMAKKESRLYINLPMHIEALSWPYPFFIVLAILQNSKMIPSQDDEIKSVLKAIKNPSFIETARQFAENVNDKAVILYSSRKLHSLARKWKYSINIAKKHCFINNFPSLDNDEINAYLDNKSSDLFYVAILSDDNERQNIKKNIAITKDIIKNKGYSIIEMLIKSEGLAKLITFAYMSDWVFYYLLEQSISIEGSLIDDFRDKIRQQ